MSKARIAVAALTISAGALIGLVNSEGYVDKAMIPTKGDRPTLGYGSTFHEDGSPVKMGETTTPARAMVMAKAHISKEETIFRASLEGASLSQDEFDLYMDFAYQYGTAAWTGSSMRKFILAGQYRQACDALLQWKRAAGYDCSSLVNGQHNKRCWGVWERQLQRHQKCLGAQ